jgi:carboxypeptidase D
MHFPTQRDFGFFEKERRLTSKTFLKELRRRSDAMSPAVTAAMMKREEVEAREEKRQVYKRDLSGRANGTIDPWVSPRLPRHIWIGSMLTVPQYGCFLLDMFIDYALNFTFPWSAF